MIFISGWISMNVNRKYNRWNFSSWWAAENICGHQRPFLSSMLICLFVTFMFQSVKTTIIYFLPRIKTTNSRAATNQYIKARIYCTKSEHRFSNILYSSSKRNPSDRTDSLHNIASSSTPFLHISRKLKCLKLLKWIRLSLLLHGMFPSFWRQTEYLWNAGKEKQKQIRNVI